MSAHDALQPNSCHEVEKVYETLARQLSAHKPLHAHRRAL
jgi:hypothetical protein